MEVLSGLDQLAAGEIPASLRRARIAFVSHAGATSWRFRSGLEELLACGLDVVGVVAPEHGYSGAGQAGQSEPAAVAPGGPAHFDAYRRDARAIESWLAQSSPDVVLVDFVDIGARSWTYLSTMEDALAAAARLGIAAVVLDRPNPLGGLAFGGPPLEDGAESYVGRAHVPLKHGLTLGELAQEMCSRAGMDIELTIVPVRGWARSAMFPDYGSSWVPPSPNIPSWEVACAYPGAVLFEGTNLSEGRGTTRPFLTFGAPFADRAWAEAVRAASPEAVGVRALSFVPVSGPYSGRPLEGMGLHVLDPTRFDPLHFALVALRSAIDLYGERVELHASAFDRLAGTTTLRESLAAGDGADRILQRWAPGLQAFAARRSSLLRYH